jgi:hypothetical protein
MLINEKGINTAIERRQNEDAQKIKENKKFLTDIVKQMSSFETILHDIIDTFNYCRSHKIDDLLITVFEVNNVKVNLGLDIATGKYDFIEFGSIVNGITVRWWPEEKIILIKRTCEISGLSSKLEARLVNDNLLFIDTVNHTIKTMLSEPIVKNFLTGIPNTIKQSIDIIYNKLNSIK